MTDLHHFYHIFADGDWGVPVKEHVQALQRGLAEKLDSFQIGIVGCPDNRERVKTYLRTMGIPYTICNEADHGWEQVTLDKLWEFAQDHDGYVSYAHTKGAANYADINNSWRRSMEWHNIINWFEAVSLLDGGKTIVGCHWIKGGPAENPAFGTGGMFGGNYWWTNLSLVRQNVPPNHASRFHAEHWLGQLSECMPITDETIGDMNAMPISFSYLHSDW